MPVTPANRAQYDALLVVRVVKGKPVELRVASGANTKGVLPAYPVAMSLRLLLRHPRVLEAERFQTKDGPTLQAFTTVVGPLPGSLDLGSWGVFLTRPYTMEPCHCFRSHQLGHYRASAPAPQFVAFVQNRDDTEQCLTKYRAGEPVTSKCPICH